MTEISQICRAPNPKYVVGDMNRQQASSAQCSGDFKGNHLLHLLDNRCAAYPAAMPGRPGEMLAQRLVRMLSPS